MAATDNIAGHEGTVTIGAAEIYITNFSITVEGDPLNVTDSSCTTWEESIPSGFKRWSGSLEGFVKDGTATNTIGAAAAEGVFTAETGVTWTGNLILTNKTISLQVSGGDAVKVAYNFIGTGALTEANS